MTTKIPPHSLVVESGDHLKTLRQIETRMTGSNFAHHTVRLELNAVAEKVNAIAGVALQGSNETSFRDNITAFRLLYAKLIKRIDAASTMDPPSSSSSSSSFTSSSSSSTVSSSFTLNSIQISEEDPIDYFQDSSNLENNRRDSDDEGEYNPEALELLEAVFGFPDVSYRT